MDHLGGLAKFVYHHGKLDRSGPLPPVHHVFEAHDNA